MENKEFWEGCWKVQNYAGGISAFFRPSKKICKNNCNKTQCKQYPRSKDV